MGAGNLALLWGKRLLTTTSLCLQITLEEQAQPPAKPLQDQGHLYFDEIIASGGQIEKRTRSLQGADLPFSE